MKLLAFMFAVWLGINRTNFDISTASRIFIFDGNGGHLFEELLVLYW